jgi:hypothetical protein
MSNGKGPIVTDNTPEESVDETEDLDQQQKSMGKIAQEETANREAPSGLDSMQTSTGSAAQSEVTHPPTP